ncbi:MAG: transcriptional regulator [Eubacterium sp.]|nr:transcriptional regulator [Eubacterium sp.]
MKEYVINSSICGKDIRRAREILTMTQKEFASFVCSSKRTIENWESKEEQTITGPIVPLIEILLRRPELAEKLEYPRDRMRMRLIYMYKSMVCSVIDVDEPERKVRVKNYIDNPLFRAFGRNTEPNFDDYEEFLRSRCFPETRDKMKLELRRLGLPFYAPLMIIEKTEGRMADSWLGVLRRKCHLDDVLHNSGRLDAELLLEVSDGSIQ